MIICNFNFISAIHRPFETNSILIIYANAVFSSSIHYQCLRIVARWNSELFQKPDRVNLIQFSWSELPWILRAGLSGILDVLAVENIFCFIVLEKLRNNLPDFAKTYNFPGAHRTSNMIDRLMKSMDRHLFTTCCFHGYITSAELNIRGWALNYNFAPSNPLTVIKK